MVWDLELNFLIKRAPPRRSDRRRTGGGDGTFMQSRSHLATCVAPSWSAGHEKEEHELEGQ